ncbi:hypothetical protein [Nocardioides solisilvae]|uniref:hypothetical protein n=1 Tax=Nocardioides solisilvae TaxID=1542435 RepID=UPI0013A5425C|nr:hypothetical protein [Nocardioides solisilvae]
MVVLTGLLAVVVRRFAVPVTNPDTFFHLRLGREFLEGWKPWDPGSVTPFATADWAPTQWLSQVLYAWVESFAGLAGVAWLTGTVTLAYVVVVALVGHRLGGLLVAAPVTCLTVAASLPFLSARPQVASYVFLVLVSAAWLRTGRGGGVPWWTVPLTWLWAMVHGMWVAGVLVGVVAALGSTLDRKAGTRDAGSHPLWQVWAVPALSCVVAGLTPVGPALWTATTRVGGISTYFAEWGAPELTDPTTALAACMAGLTLLLRLRRGDQSWLELALLALALLWLVYAQRSVPVAVAMLVPLLADSLGSLSADRGRARRHTDARTLVVLGVVASAALAAAVPFTSTAVPRGDTDASATLASLPQSTPLLTDWGMGGTDLWLYPHLHVVMHGYGDMFTDDELRRNADIVDLEPGWDDELRELGATHALVIAHTPLAYALEDGAGWNAEDTVQDGSTELVHLVAPEDWLDDSAG